MLGKKLVPFVRQTDGRNSFDISSSSSSLAAPAEHLHQSHRISMAPGRFPPHLPWLAREGLNARRCLQLNQGPISRDGEVAPSKPTRWRSGYACESCIKCLGRRGEGVVGGSVMRGKSITVREAGGEAMVCARDGQLAGRTEARLSGPIVRVRDAVSDEPSLGRVSSGRSCGFSRYVCLRGRMQQTRTSHAICRGRVNGRFHGSHVSK